jgi:hypothetical protein
MKTAIAALLIIGMATKAFADTYTCIPQDPGWWTPYSQGTIQTIGYGLNSLYFTAIFRTNTVRAFQAVPLTIANRFTSLTNADSTFYAQVAPYYGESMLTELNGGPCPILTESGNWLRTH